jgi:hypothetical protein
VLEARSRERPLDLACRSRPAPGHAPHSSSPPPATRETSPSAAWQASRKRALAIYDAEMAKKPLEDAPVPGGGLPFTPDARKLHQVKGAQSVLAPWTRRLLLAGQQGGVRSRHAKQATRPGVHAAQHTTTAVSSPRTPALLDGRMPTEPPGSSTKAATNPAASVSSPYPAKVMPTAPEHRHALRAARPQGHFMPRSRSLEAPRRRPGHKQASRAADAALLFALVSSFAELSRSAEAAVLTQQGLAVTPAPALCTPEHTPPPQHAQACTLTAPTAAQAFVPHDKPAAMTIAHFRSSIRAPSSLRTPASAWPRLPRPSDSSLQSAGSSAAAAPRTPPQSSYAAAHVSMSGRRTGSGRARTASEPPFAAVPPGAALRSVALAIVDPAEAADTVLAHSVASESRAGVHPLRAAELSLLLRGALEAQEQQVTLDSEVRPTMRLRHAATGTAPALCSCAVMMHAEVCM